MKFENIEMLIDGAGEITIGTIAPIHCAATGADDGQCLAVLCGRPDESFEDLL